MHTGQDTIYRLSRRSFPQIIRIRTVGVSAPLIKERESGAVSRSHESSFQQMFLYYRESLTWHCFFIITGVKCTKDIRKMWKRLIEVLKRRQLLIRSHPRNRAIFVLSIRASKPFQTVMRAILRKHAFRILDFSLEPRYVVSLRLSSSKIRTKDEQTSDCSRENFLLFHSISNCREFDTETLSESVAKVWPEGEGRGEEVYLRVIRVYFVPGWSEEKFRARPYDKSLDCSKTILGGRSSLG